MSISRWLLFIATTGLFLGCMAPLPEEEEDLALEQAYIRTADDAHTEAPTEKVCENVCEFYGWDSASCHACWRNCVTCGLSGASPQTLQGEDDLGSENSCPPPPDSYGMCFSEKHCEILCEDATGLPYGACYEGCCYCAAT